VGVAVADAPQPSPIASPDAEGLECKWPRFDDDDDDGNDVIRTKARRYWPYCIRLLDSVSEISSFSYKKRLCSTSGEEMTILSQCSNCSRRSSLSSSDLSEKMVRGHVLGANSGRLCGFAGCVRSYRSSDSQHREYTIGRQCARACGTVQAYDVRIHAPPRVGCSASTTRRPACRSPSQ